MSYQEALEAAGAEVIEFGRFGSYQGDWWAKVRVGEQLGWINGRYGSCSGCDAFQAEFGWSDDGCNKHEYAAKDDCVDCLKVKADYNDKLKAFGSSYLDCLISQDEAEKEASRNLEWDSDAQEMVDFIKSHALD